MTKSCCILIVEDDPSISELIQTTLQKAGYQTETAYDGEEGANKLEQGRYDLVLLDIMLPKIDGYELLEYIRPTGTPVIFITAKGQVKDRIQGLRLGADDYLVKPFQVGELLARMEAVLRRTGKGRDRLQFAGVELDFSLHRVWKNGVPVELTNKEFDLLAELMRQPNVALSRARLYENVWQEPYSGQTRTLDCHIQRLRQKLDWGQQIQTVFRIGYRLEGDG